MTKVDYKQFNISREERLQEQEDVIRLRPYIFALKEKELGVIKCERCGSMKGVEIHHKRYGADVNYYDLELLCKDCHKIIRPNRYDYIG